MSFGVKSRMASVVGKVRQERKVSGSLIRTQGRNVLIRNYFRHDNAKQKISFKNYTAKIKKEEDQDAL